MLYEVITSTILGCTFGVSTAAVLTVFFDKILKLTGILDEHSIYLTYLDTGAGLSKETLKFITAADECLVVTTPEPTSITDSYNFV